MGQSMKVSGSRETKMAKVDKFTRMEIFMLENTTMVRDRAVGGCMW